MPQSLHGRIRIPGDKSISHRGIMLGSIARGMTELFGFLDGADCRSSIACFRQLGVDIIQEGDHIRILGGGLHGLQQPKEILNVGNSGTTARLMSGILAGQSFPSSLTGDASIRRRPMTRIIDPLHAMGARIRSRRDDGCAPLDIEPSALRGIDYLSPLASAQVKSSVLLAGLYAQGKTSVTEPAKSRDHSERMLRAFGADLIEDGLTVSISPNPDLTGQKIHVPGDISSAAYWIAAASIIPGSEIIIENVNINPTRDGILHIARAMGADIEEINPHTVSQEPVADLFVRSAGLHGTRVDGPIIPRLIDEIPVIALMAACAEGVTTIADAHELRVKESDRIESMVKNLSAMGVSVTGTDDGMVICGGASLRGADIVTCHDHRIAMTFAVASLLADGPVHLDDPDCVSVSYPGFYRSLQLLLGQ